MHVEQQHLLSARDAQLQLPLAPPASATLPRADLASSSSLPSNPHPLSLHRLMSSISKSQASVHAASLKGQTVLLTGAASGLGKDVALLFASHGYVLFAGMILCLQADGLNGWQREARPGRPECSGSRGRQGGARVDGPVSSLLFSLSARTNRPSFSTASA